jgi:hypothetical protein
MRDAIDSTVATRHLIAHGESTGITFATVESRYKRIVEAIEVIEAACC